MFRSRFVRARLRSAWRSSPIAADRQWQTGTWTEFSVQRQMMEFGPGVTPFDRGRRTSSMRAMADVGVYVIETAALRLELKDVRPINKPGLDAIVGQPVTFALREEPGRRPRRRRPEYKLARDEENEQAAPVGRDRSLGLDLGPAEGIERRHQRRRDLVGRLILDLRALEHEHQLSVAQQGDGR